MTSINDNIRDIYANLSWYRLHSNYTDPAYTKQAKLYATTFSSTPKTNFSLIVDLGNVVDLSPILKYGSCQCSAPGKEAYLDSAVSCILFQLPYFLENIQFGYLCGLVIIPIMLISLFGKIKESYRWFLLNQAIFDSFMCYSFICEKPTLLAWSGTSYLRQSTCFYSGRPTNAFLEALFALVKGSFRNAPYIPLFLLAFSRCISLYFPKFYQRHNKTWKVLAFIVIFDVTVIFLSTFFKLFYQLLAYIRTNSIQNCFKEFCLPQYSNFSVDFNNCFQTNEKFFQCQNSWVIYTDSFQSGDRLNLLSVTPTMIFIVLICVTALFLKISVQLKYQLTHNRYAFLKTTKVAAVILIQSFSLAIYVTLITIQQYLIIDANEPYFFDSRKYQALPYSTFLFQSFATTTSINIIRIFFDSFIVLMILSGYRKRLFRFIFFIFSFYKNPFFVNEIKNYFRKNHRTRTSMTAVKSIPTVVLKK